MTSPETKVRAAERIKEFLADDAVAACLGRLERKYYEQFIAADSSEARVKAWAAANVLRDFHSQLQSVVTDGANAEHEILRIAKVEQARKTGRPLPHE